MAENTKLKVKDKQQEEKESKGKIISGHWEIFWLKSPANHGFGSTGR